MLRPPNFPGLVFADSSRDSDIRNQKSKSYYRKAYTRQNGTFVLFHWFTIPRTAHLQNRPRETQLPAPLCPGSVEHFDKSSAPEDKILIILIWSMPFGQTVYWILEIADSLKSWFSFFCSVSHLSNCINSLADSFNSGPPEILVFYFNFHFLGFVIII